MIHTNFRFRADTTDSIGNQRCITPVYYGLSRGRFGVAPATNMLVSYNAERGTARLHPHPCNWYPTGFACRILHDDILEIGAHRFRVHCPTDWRADCPDLRRIETQVPA